MSLFRYTGRKPAPHAVMRRRWAGRILGAFWSVVSVFAWTFDKISLLSKLLYLAALAAMLFVLVGATTLFMMKKAADAYRFQPDAAPVIEQHTPKEIEA